MAVPVPATPKAPTAAQAVAIVAALVNVPATAAIPKLTLSSVSI